MTIDEDDIKDLKYELRLLLGASKIVSLFNTHQGIDIGNNINYFKDSAYIHTRNLYNFFSSGSKFDLKIAKYTDHNFDLNLCNEWSEAINRHVLHVSPGRKDPTNCVNGKWLYDQVPAFAEDLSNLWKEWIEATEVDNEKQQLTNILEKADSEAQNDCDQLASLMNKVPR